MTFWRKKKPYMGLRNPRWLRRYPLREVTGIRRFGRDVVKMDLVRQPRPRRHAQAPRGVRTKLDALVLLEERAAGVEGSLQERIFYQALVDHGFIPDVDFTYQAAEFGGRAVLGGLVADFMFEVPMVIVQVQSDWHRMSLEIERRDMDQTSMLESLGYTVLEIWPNTIDSRAALDLWIERNITHLWGTSSTPLTTGGSARSQAYREALGFNMDDLARLEARVAQIEAALTGEVIVESELDLALSRLELPSQLASLLQDSEILARVERLESALFAGGTGPAVRISSGYIAQHLSSSNFVSGSTGWRISRDGTAEFQDLIARGSMQSDNFVAGSEGWKIYDTGDAEFHNVTIRGEIIGATFKQNAASAVGGLLMTAPASVIAADITAVATTVTVKDAQFSDNDFIYVKVGGTYEVMQVTAGGGTTSLTVTRGVAGTPTAWKEGTGIIRWGNRLEQDTVSAYSPFLDIIAHNPDGATAGWTDNTDSDSMSLTTGDTYIAWLGDEALGGSGHAPIYDMQTITKVRVWQTQAVSGNLRAGLYRYAVTAQSSTAVLLAQGTASFSGAGAVEVTLGSSQQVDTLNYYYFFAFQCDNATADLTAFAYPGTYHYVRAGVGYGDGLPSPIGSIGSGQKRIAIGVYWALPYDGSRMKVRLGNLAGVTNPWMAPTGYGLYSQNTFLEGTLVAGSGAVLLDDEGIKITQGLTGANSIRWVDATTDLVSMYGYLVMPGSTARGFQLLLHNSQVTNDAHTITIGVSSVGGKYGSPAIVLKGEFDYTAYINFDASQGGLAHADGQAMRLNLGNLTLYPPIWFSEKSSTPGTPSTGKLAVYARSDSNLYAKDDAGTERMISWPYGEVLTVGPNAKYSTVASAISAASSGDLIWVSKGEFNEGALVLPAGVFLKGMGSKATLIQSSTELITLTVGSGCSVQDIGIKNTTTSASDTTAISMLNTSGSSATIRDCYIYSYNAGAGQGHGIRATSSHGAYLWYNDVTGQGSSSSAALHITGGATFSVFGGNFSGNIYALYLNGAGAAVFNVGFPRYWGASSDVSLAVGTLLGEYLAGSAGESVLPYDGTFDMDERASSPSTPMTSRWKLYFLSDGLYHKKDDGTVTGPLGTGGSDRISGVTKTVKTSGGDFTTIQAAIDWFMNYTIEAGCYIDVDAGTWTDAAGTIDCDGLTIVRSDGLTLRGDTRDLAGLSYVDGAHGNPAALTNGGSGVVTLSNAGNNITVVCATTNPDFDADGWVNGDKLLTLNNAGTVAEYTISSTLNNVITLTSTAPTIGGDGTAICLLPNRRILRTTAGTCVRLDNVINLAIDGFFLYNSASGSACYGLSLGSNSREVSGQNLVARVEDQGFRVGFDCAAGLNTGAVSAWDCGGQGFYALHAASLYATYGFAVGCNYGFYSNAGSYLYASNSVGARNNQNYRAHLQSTIWCSGAYARGNAAGWGMYSTANSMIMADGTNGQVNCATNYSPNPAGAGQYAESSSNYGVLYYS